MARYWRGGYRKGGNWHRWFYLTMRHYERKIAYYGRNGASIGLIEAAVKAADWYRDNWRELG